MKKQFDVKRPISWSSISSFEWDPEQWYQSYVLGIKTPPNKEMIFGKEVGERLAFDPTYLSQVPRLPIFEHRLLTSFAGIPMVGYIDSFSLDHKILYEYKTGKTAWTQKRADTHGQIDCYLLMLYQIEKMRPEDVQCFIHWLPTEETLVSMHDADSSIILIDPCKPVTFETKRTMKDILLFGSRLKKVYNEMKKYAKEHE